MLDSPQSEQLKVFVDLHWLGSLPLLAIQLKDLENSVSMNSSRMSIRESSEMNLPTSTEE